MNPFLPRMPVVRELEVAKVAMFRSFSRKELAYLNDRSTFEVTQMGADDLVMKLHAFIVKGPEKEVKRETVSQEKQEVFDGGSWSDLESLSAIPASPWNYFKAEVVSRLGALGRWWLTRWPVEVKIVGAVTRFTAGAATINHTTHNHTTVIRETRTCHHIPVPKDARGYDSHLRFLSFDEDNPVPPPRPRPYCLVCMSPPDHPYRGDTY